MQNFQNDAKYNQLLNDLKAKSFKISKPGKSFQHQRLRKSTYRINDQAMLQCHQNHDIIKTTESKAI